METEIDLVELLRRQRFELDRLREGIRAHEEVVRSIVPVGGIRRSDVALWALLDNEV